MRTLLLVLVAFGFPAGRSFAQGTPKDLIEKSIQAHGGEQNLAKLKTASIKAKGTYSLGGEIAVTMETIYQLPGQFKKVEVLELAGNKVSVITVLNGDKGWVNAKGQTTELDAKLLTELKEGINHIRVMSLTPLRDKSYQLSPLGELKVNGRLAPGIKVTVGGHRDMKVYFDKETGLIAKLERRASFAGKEGTMEITFLDYQDYDGLKYPRKAMVHADGKKLLDYETTEVKFLDKVAAGVFAKP